MKILDRKYKQKIAYILLALLQGILVVAEIMATPAFVLAFVDGFSSNSTFSQTIRSPSAWPLLLFLLLLLSYPFIYTIFLAIASGHAKRKQYDKAVGTMIKPLVIPIVILFFVLVNYRF